MTYRYIPVCLISFAALLPGARTAKADEEPQANAPAAPALLTIYTADINPATGAVLSAPTRLDTALPNSWLPQYSKDGRRLAYLSSMAGSGIQEITRRPEPLLSIRSLDTGHTTSFPVRLDRVFSFDWSPDGRKLVVRGADSRSAIVIHMIDVATGAMTPLAIGTPKVERYTQPHWADDSRRVYYGKGTPGVLGEPLMERDLDTGEERLLLDFSDVKTPDSTAFTPRGYLISPDRRHVAALGPPASGFRPGAAFNNPQALWVVPVDTKIGRRLKFEGFPYPSMGPAFAWTADSRAVLIISGEGPEQNARRNLWLVPIDGSAPVNLAIDLPIQNVSAAIHPNGRQVAFVSGPMPQQTAAGVTSVLSIQQLPSGIRVRRPAYQAGAGPLIAFYDAPPDKSSANEQYPGLLALLEADGYRTRRITGPLSPSSLKDAGVLFIRSPGSVAALKIASAHAGRPADAEVDAVQAAFLTDREVSVLVDWVRDGGSLLLIADHPPFPLAAAKLTAALGVTNWPNGNAGVRTDLCGPTPGNSGCWAPDPDGHRSATNIVFHRPEFPPKTSPALVTLEGPASRLAYQSAAAVLARHPITEGREPGEQVRRVVTIGGSAFQPPRGSIPILTLPPTAVIRRRLTADAPIGGWVQGAVTGFGNGRLALFAESAILSGGIDVTPGTVWADNRQFVLNVMHWLTRVL